jgi:CubicO group peptidase (beta-lactamase class C family)
MSKNLPSKLLDVYNASFVTLSVELPSEQDLKTNSRDKEWLTGRVLDVASARLGSDGELFERNGREEIFSIASVTKTFSAVAIAKVATSTEFSKYFDEEDPLGTKIEAFAELIKKHGSENEKRYISELKSTHPNYQNITLRHLLNHTAGIEDPSYFDEFRADQSKSFRFEDGKYFSPLVRNFGDHSYSNVGYELAALMAKVVVSEERERLVKFTGILREQIIDPLELTHTFTPDQMSVEANDVVVRGQEDIHVAQGYDYYCGKITTGQDFNCDVASGGIYSSAADVAKFYRGVASEEIFRENPRAAKEFFSERNFVLTGQPAEEKYGLGIRKIANEKIEYFHHGGAGVLFYSHAICERKKGYPETAKSSVALLSYENLTRPIATKLLGDQKQNETGHYFVDQELAEKMNWLTENFSTKQLISLRQTLENSPEKFEKEFEKLTKPETHFRDLVTKGKKSAEAEDIYNKKSFANRVLYSQDDNLSRR